jgi:hypothetical protein
MEERKAMSYFRHTVRAGANPNTTPSKQQIMPPPQELGNRIVNKTRRTHMRNGRTIH